MRRGVRAAAGFKVFFRRPRLGSYHPHGVRCVGGGSPKTRRAEQRRRWSYLFIERILLCLWLDGSVLARLGGSSWLKN